MTLNSISRHVGRGIAYYLATTIVVCLGVAFGMSHLRPPTRTIDRNREDSPVLEALTQWDGEWYTMIARDGYSYEPGRLSSVAFFPVYPLAGRVVSWVLDIPHAAALVLVAQLALVTSLALLSAYVSDVEETYGPAFAHFTLLGFAMFPTTFFFRMAYSESIFLVFCLAAFLGMKRRWPLPTIVGFIALATGTRLVGVALVIPLLRYVWLMALNRRHAVLLCLLVAPLACSGLLGYMAYQWIAFHAPMAFANTTQIWRQQPELPFAEHLLVLLSWEPIWTVYVSSSPAHWRRIDPDTSWLFSLQFANPVYFLLTIALTTWGVAKKWISIEELLFVFGLLAISYCGRAYEMSMSSQARYAAVAFPLYFVLGRCCDTIPLTLRSGSVAIYAVFLGVYTSLFAAGYVLI